MHNAVFCSLWRRLLGGALLSTLLLGCAQQPAVQQPKAQQPKVLQQQQSQPQQQPDPSGRVLYISALDSGAWQVVDPNWIPGTRSPQAVLNWPMTSGTVLQKTATNKSARAELDGGWITFRLSNWPAGLEITQWDDTKANVLMENGTLSVRVRYLQPGQKVNIKLDVGSLSIDQPGEYRVDFANAMPRRVTVRAGAVKLQSEGINKSSVLVAAGHQATINFDGTIKIVRGAPVHDAFDRWVAARDALQDRSASAAYVSRDMPGYQALDGHGNWARNPTYGAVWYPKVRSGWKPYSDGYWGWQDPWGWTWVDAEPWGFAPFHYGRWTQIKHRWAWVPGPKNAQLVYAPALVGLAGDNKCSSTPAKAWFALAPGEYWQPAYRASDAYFTRLMGNNRRPAGGNYRFQSSALVNAHADSTCGTAANSTLSIFPDNVGVDISPTVDTGYADLEHSSHKRSQRQ